MEMGTFLSLQAAVLLLHVVQSYALVVTHNFVTMHLISTRDFFPYCPYVWGRCVSGYDTLLSLFKGYRHSLIPYLPTQTFSLL
ncbi:hypothetical protein GDO81_023090 [Engystomops pustulosus]|uniref:Secreted protein n=1 Tax=Engystomops pustulosus TaxID=76066 RepID=A0AAV6YMR9_ENGPU|nr:hypothetical protein GDO81_023090 [Engystomops pustulosus]